MMHEDAVAVHKHLSKVFPKGRNALGASETGYGTDYVFVQIIESSVIVNKFSFSVPALARIWLRAG